MVFLWSFLELPNPFCYFKIEGHFSGHFGGAASRPLLSSYRLSFCKYIISCLTSISETIFYKNTISKGHQMLVQSLFISFNFKLLYMLSLV